METVRKLVQTLWVFLVNGFWGFPWTRTIYQGPLKVICSPGLNCYSCPAATTYCPLGSLQQLLLSIRFSLETGSYYLGTFVVGSMGLLGAAFGRFICGWACPFGLFQELLYKIPSVKLPVPKPLTWLKYGFLVLFVIIFPLVFVDEFGLGAPWFCKYLCPAGTLEAGIPMLILQPDLKSTIGWLYWNKIAILLLFVVWSIVSSRPFCRTTCPLGAFYGLFNRHRLIRLQHNPQNCTQCGACHRVCPMGIHFNETPHSRECISCLKCMTQACNFGAISVEVAGYSLLDNALPAIKKPSEQP
ncbi:MAG TPA: (4Fe-4S)-binding protein [Desulfobulbaceae bacterium]|nr:(4Fe-4S)-binding protein [Desulfobulbaceae bacterium]